MKLSVLTAVLFDTRKNQLVRNISTGTVLGILFVAGYLFFNRLIFSYVVSLEEIGFLLIDRLVSIGFLAFFFMLIISSFTISFATLFRSRETEYLFSMPISKNMLLLGKYIDIVVFSSWAIMLMAIPILFAYARVRDFGVFQYLLSLSLTLLPFVIIATSIGTIIAIMSLYMTRFMSMRRLIVYGIILFSLLIYAVIQFSQPNQLTIPFTEDFRALNVFLNNFRLNSHPFTPNFWMIQSLRALVLHEYPDFIMYSAAMITSAFFALTLLLFVGEHMYLETWRYSCEMDAVKSQRSSGGWSVFNRTPSTQGQALVGKEILMFLRDPAQWTQLLLILALLSLYLFNLSLLPEDINNERYLSLISIMNFGFCGFILATLAIRFVFPSISMEGDAFWVLGSAPLDVRTLFRIKFMHAFILFFVVGEIIAYVSGRMLGYGDMFQLLTTWGIFLMSISLACLAVGFGAAFPDFSERNPSRIATSPGGILTIVVSLAYIGIMMVLLAIPAMKYTDYLVSGGEFPLKQIYLSIVLGLVLNAVTVIFPLWYGSRVFARRDF